MSKFLLITSIISLLLSSFAHGSQQSDVIYTKKSLYGDISVTESNGLRCLIFALIKGDSIQSCQPLNPNDPRLVYSYSKMVIGGFLLNPTPQKILILGLGGATIPNVLSELYPDTKIDIVELDPAVIEIAKDYFQFQETPNMNAVAGDGRVFVKRSILQKKQYDVIILDAFTGEYIPEHLMTREFLQEVKQLMSNDGILIANTWETSKLYDYESVTYHKEFGKFYNFKIPPEEGGEGNRIIIASKNSLPSKQELEETAKQLMASLTRYDIQVDNFPKLMSTKQDWDTSVRPLTDQYSPANLLR
ncbi:spermidine synthase [Thiomicrorhabdus sediminis]|uniref:Polyamine aminopropyltransferase n=1 Tax=Thiomicrorhabdus sediminis TaxID=2580412 RepID=A0A4P9K3T8_9GAMM|nr:fused MFS/spermidine synthase [Thiomicrorhabdus sediminis]QCU89594.1 spermidine synthase [Thiomicrorhabdus sediminis]